MVGLEVGMWLNSTNEIKRGNLLRALGKDLRYRVHDKRLQSCLTLCQPMDIVARQAPLPMGFSRKESWRGLPRPFPGHLPNTGIEPWSPALASGFFSTSATRGFPCGSDGKESAWEERGAWQATVHGVTEGRVQLSMHACILSSGWKLQPIMEEWQSQITLSHYNQAWSHRSPSMCPACVGHQGRQHTGRLSSRNEMFKDEAYFLVWASGS